MGQGAPSSSTRTQRRRLSHLLRSSHLDSPTRGSASPTNDVRNSRNEAVASIGSLLPFHLSLFDLVSGLAAGNVRITPPLLPSCWDELLDWCDNATAISSQQLRRGDDDDDVDGCLTSATTPSSSWNQTISRRHCSEKGKSESVDLDDKIRFIPFVRTCSIGQVKGMHSLNWVQLATFYSESVSVLGFISLFFISKVYLLYEHANTLFAVARNEPTRKVVVAVQFQKTRVFVALLPIGKFSQYHSLLCRLADLLDVQLTTAAVTALGGANAQGHEVDAAADSTCSAVRRAEMERTKAVHGRERNECMICRNQAEQSVLSCSHSLCRQCEQQWVRKRLACPFCRQRFANAREVRRTGWELTEWSRRDIDKDVAVLREKVEEFWVSTLVVADSSTCALPATSYAISEMLDLYSFLPRTIEFDVGDEADGERSDKDGRNEDDFVVVRQHAHPSPSVLLRDSDKKCGGIDEEESTAITSLLSRQ